MHPVGDKLAPGSDNWQLVLQPNTEARAGTKVLWTDYEERDACPGLHFTLTEA
jgi:hypothetical protein